MPKQTQTHQRNFEVRAADYNETDRTLTLSFSSDAPVDRWGESEILSHAPGAIDFSRLLTAGALLFNHDRDKQLGRVMSANLRDDGKAEAVVKFGRGEFASEKLQDVRDGILLNVSVSYTVEEWNIDTKENTRTAVKWTPIEISLVTIPADTTVGVGRAMQTFEPDSEPATRRTKDMDGEPNAAASGADVTKVRQDELARIREITTIGEQLNMREAATAAIERGLSVSDFQALCSGLAKAKPVITGERAIEVGEQDLKRYSFLRGIRAMVSGKPLDGLERELSDEYAKKNNRSTGGFFVPDEVLSYQRAMTVTGDTGTKGGATVQTTVTDFIGLLNNAMMTRTMGARMLTGLVGDLAIPKQTGGTTAYWLTENQAPTTSDFTIGSVALAPKRLGAYTEVSRQLIMQSSIGAEMLVREDIATRMALALDLAVINGLGASNQPKGILHADNHTAVYAGSTPGAVAAVGTNATGHALTWSDIVNLLGAAATNNALMGTLGFLTNAKVMAQLMQTEKAEGTAQFIWPDARTADGLGMLAGYRAGVSNQIPANLAKGGSGNVLSAIIFGNWSDVMIGMWGGLEIVVDATSAALAKENKVGIVANQLCDVAVRRKQSFAAIKDAIA